MICKMIKQRKLTQTNSRDGNNLEEDDDDDDDDGDDDEDTKDNKKGSNDNVLANSSEKDANVVGNDRKSSNLLDSNFALSSQPTLADISEVVDIWKKNKTQLKEHMKDNYKFDDFEDKTLEEEDTIDGNKEKMEESTDNEKVCNTEGDKKTQIVTQEKWREKMVKKPRH